MRLPRPGRRSLIAVLVILAVLVALRAAAPVIVNTLFVNALADYGVDAQIANVDLDIFAGRITLHDGHGRDDSGHRFRVKRMSGRLAFWPLWSKHVSFHDLEIKNAQVDLHRSAHNAVNLGGVQILAPAGKRQSSGWSLGFDQFVLDNVAVAYSQPAMNGVPAVDQTVTFHNSTARNVRFFASNPTMKVDANADVADGHLAIDGSVRPFGETLKSRFKLKTRSFDLPVLAFATHRGSFKSVTGRLTSRLTVTLNWPTDKALVVNIKGRANWHNPNVTNTDGLKTKALRFKWHGRIQGHLARPAGRPGTLSSQSTLEFKNLDMRRPKTIFYTADHGTWHGKTKLVIAKHADRLQTNGKLSAASARFGVPSWFALSLDAMDWNGKVGLRIGQLVARNANGRLETHAAQLEFDQVPLSIRADQWTFDGHYDAQPNPKDSVLTLGLNATTTARDLIAINTRIGSDWLSTDSLHATNLKADSINRFTVEQLDASRLRLLQRPRQPAQNPGDHAAILIKSLAAHSLALDNLRSYHVKKAQTNGVVLRILRDDNGRIPAARFFGGSSNDRTTSKNAGSSRHKSATSLVLGDWSVAGDSRFYFRDNSIDPSAKIDAHAVRLHVTGLNTATPDKPAHYTLDAKLGQYASASSQGDIAPLARGGPNADATMRIRSLDLVPLSGYANATFKQGIARGRLNSTIHATARHGDLGGKATVRLSNLKLDAGQSPEAKASIGISIGQALEILRTDDDTIKLSAALRGDLTDPSFSSADLVREAVFAAIKSALTSNYSPVGLIKDIGSALANLGTDELQLHSVAFHDNSTHMTAAARTYLEHVKTLLEDHPSVTLTITPRAAHGKDRQSQAEAKARATAVHDYLAARDIDPGRLHIASPERARPQNAAQVGLAVRKRATTR